MFQYTQIILDKNSIASMFLDYWFYMGVLCSLGNVVLYWLYSKRIYSKEMLASKYFMLIYIVTMIIPSPVVFRYYADISSNIMFISIQLFPLIFLNVQKYLCGKVVVNQQNLSNEARLGNFKIYNNFVSIFIFFTMGVVVFFLINLLMGGNKIPFVTSILSKYDGHDFKEVQQIVRFQVYSWSTFSQFLHALLIRSIFPFCLGVTLAVFEVKNNYKLLLFIILCYMSFSVLSLERSQILFFGLIMLLSMYFFIKNKKTLAILLFCFIPVMFIIFGVVALKQYAWNLSHFDNIIGYIGNVFLYRVIIDPVFMTYLAILKFPIGSDWLLLSNLKILSIIGLIKSSGISSIGMIGDAWASFRVLGVLIYPLCIAELLFYIESNFIKSRSPFYYANIMILVSNSIINIYSVMLPTMFIASILFIIIMNKIEQYMLSKAG